MRKKFNQHEILLAIGDQKDPPTEFRIFANGMNPTTKGPVFCDQQACEAVMARFKKKGLDRLPVDYGHGMVYGTDSRAAGWFVPANRSGELWATDVQWTPTALKALSDREYRFFSPWLMATADDDRICELMNVALVGMPATMNQKPLVMNDSGEEDEPQQPKVKTMDPELARLLGILGCVAVAEVEPKVKKLGEHAASLALQVATLTTENTALATQVADLAKAAETGKRDTLIATLSAAGKLPPALHGWAKSVALDVLEGFGSAAPVVTANGSTVTAPASAAPLVLDANTELMLSQFGLSGKTAEFKATAELIAQNGGRYIPPQTPALKVSPV